MLYLKYHPCKTLMGNTCCCNVLPLLRSDHETGGIRRTSWKSDRQNKREHINVRLSYKNPINNPIMHCGGQKPYQCDWQVLWHAGHLSQNSPEYCGSSHTHLPHRHLPRPLQSSPLVGWQVAVETGQLQLSPAQPSMHTQSPDTHTPRPEEDRQTGDEREFQNSSK